MADPQHPDIAALVERLETREHYLVHEPRQQPHTPSTIALLQEAAAALRSARAAAIEEAARVAEEKYADPGWNGMIRGAAESIAAAIRALGEESAAPREEAISPSP